MSEVKGQCHILCPVSNQCTSFSFHINRTNYSWDMTKIMFDLEKTHPKFLKKICQNKSFQQNFSKIYSGNNYDYGNKAAMFCSGPMIGSYLIAQTSKFLLINATAMTLGQGHGKVIQYISQDPYILCVKYLRFSSNGFDKLGRLRFIFNPYEEVSHLKTMKPGPDYGNNTYIKPHYNLPFIVFIISGIILCMHTANERGRYIVMSSLVGWMHTPNDWCNAVYIS